MLRDGRIGIACVFVAMMMLLSGLTMTAGTIMVQGMAMDAPSTTPSLPAAPSAPQALAVDQGDGRLWLWWDHPATQGSELIKWYDIFRGTAPDAIDTMITSVPPGGNFYEDLEVANGVTYYYQISAHNLVGDGPRCSTMSGTPTASGTSPDAPQNVVVENQVYSARISWTAPADPGSAPVRHYNIYRGENPESVSYWTSVDASRTEFIDEETVPGNDYAYIVEAETIIGAQDSLATNVHVGGTGTVPSAPLSLYANPSDGAVMIGWTLPEDPSTGGISIFEIYRGTVSGGEDPVPIDNVTANLYGYWITWYVDGTTDNDHTYWYTVKAVGPEGTGPSSNEVFAVPSQIGVQPNAPDMIGAYAGNQQVLLNFNAFSSYFPGYVVNVTGVEVYRSTTAGMTGTLIHTIEQPLCGYYWDNTTNNGITYYYATKALWGTGGTSEISLQLSATPSSIGSAPESPMNLYANPDCDMDGYPIVLDVNVGPSLSTPILGYEIYRGTEAGGAKVLIDTVWNNFIDIDLEWKDYSAIVYQTLYYEVRAIGFYGASDSSNEAHAHASYNGETPDAPSGLTGNAVGDSVHLTWTFPDYLGMANFIYFDVYADYDGSGVWEYIWGMNGYPGDSPSFDDISIDPGTYYYKVLAGNNYGDSSFSNVVSVTVSGGTPPGAPTDLIAYPGNGHASLDWTAPADIGSAPIDYYIVYKDGVDISHPTSPTDWIGGLTNGVTYSFTVAAHNAAGTGPQSSPILVTPRTTPGAPTSLVATHGNTEALLSWEAPSDTGGVPIEYYVVYQNGMDVAHINGLTTTISDLVNGVHSGRIQRCRQRSAIDRCLGHSFDGAWSPH
jgi:titin